MWFVYFYLGVSLLTIVLMFLSEIEIAHKFKARYPGLKPPMMSLAGKIASVLKTIIGSIVPIVNIALLLVLVFHYSELEERTIAKVYRECMREKREEE